MSSHYDARLSGVVGRLADRGAAIYCWSADAWVEQARLAGGRGTSWNAYTAFAPLLTINLSPQVCAELLRLSALRAPLREQTDLDGLAWSVGVLAHESIHVRGYLSETVAQCCGMQAIAKAALLLGRSRPEAELLAAWYWRRLYSRSPAGYSSPECRNGGLLDLRPKTQAWP